MTHHDINILLAMVILLGLLERFALHPLRMRSVDAKREEAARLQAEAFFQENMEAAREQYRELAKEHHARIRRELGLRDETETTKDNPSLRGGAATSPETFSEVLR